MGSKSCLPELPLYDPLVRLLGGEAARRELINQARIEDDHRVLDIGCGTCTIVMMLKKQFPTVEVAGVDPDPKALRRAQIKAARAGVSLQLDQAFADELPYEDSSFDRVLSSLMFATFERSVEGQLGRTDNSTVKGGWIQRSKEGQGWKYVFRRV